MCPFLQPYHNLVVCVLRTPVALLGSHSYVHQKLANHDIFGIAGKVFIRWTKLLHLIKVNL